MRALGVDAVVDSGGEISGGRAVLAVVPISGWSRSSSYVDERQNTSRNNGRSVLTSYLNKSGNGITAICTSLLTLITEKQRT